MGNHWYAFLRAEVIVPKHLTGVERGFNNWFEQVLKEAGYETEPVFQAGKEHAIFVVGKKEKPRRRRK